MQLRPLRPDFLCGRGETAYAPAREAGGRKPVRVQFPPPAPISMPRPLVSQEVRLSSGP